MKITELMKIASKHPSDEQIDSDPNLNSKETAKFKRSLVMIKNE